MKENVRVLVLDEYDYGIVIKALNCFRNELINEEREDDKEVVTDLMQKIMELPSKKKNIDKKFEER